MLGRVEKQNEKAARAEKGILSSVAAAGVMGDEAGGGSVKGKVEGGVSCLNYVTFADGNCV